MSKHYLVTLTEHERAVLDQRIVTGRGSAREHTHARILVKADAGPHGPAWTDDQVAVAMEVGLSTVARVRIVLVLDILNTHTPAALYEAFPPAEARRIVERLETHYAPKHGSWLNVGEIELSTMSGQCLNRRIRGRETLEREMAAWETERNVLGGPVNWRFTTGDARVKLKRLDSSIDG